VYDVKKGERKFILILPGHRNGKINIRVFIRKGSWIRISILIFKVQNLIVLPFIAKEENHL
jgi:hypothetical protein